VRRRAQVAELAVKGLDDVPADRVGVGDEAGRQGCAFARSRSSNAAGAASTSPSCVTSYRPMPLTLGAMTICPPPDCPARAPRTSNPAGSRFALLFGTKSSGSVNSQCAPPLPVRCCHVGTAASTARTAPTAAGSVTLFGS
jgi:hypothetical protein